MKKNILLIFVFGFLTQIYSQEKKIIINLSGGTTLSTPKTSDLTDTNINGSPETKSLINIGAFILPNLNYSFNDKTSLDFGIGFYLDRFSVEKTIGPLTEKGNRNISQIQTPINFNFYINRKKSYLLGIGGFASYIISAKENGTFESDWSSGNIIDPSDDVYISNKSEGYNINIIDKYNSLSFGAYLQLKKLINVSTNTKGFILIKINQYFNSIKDIKSNSNFSTFSSIKKEKEPTTINIGFGIIL